MAYTYKPWTPKDETKKLEEKANSYGAYEEPESVTGLRTDIDTYRTEKNPGEWNGGNYGNAVKDAYNAFASRDKFTYDLNGDALYQQYKDKYINQGRLAMADTIGQASAMTGGYGSSYATTAGSQAYQSHLQNLNDIVPQLYQMAYNKYTQEGEDLKSQYSMLSNMYDKEYGEHRDKVSDFNTNLDRLIGEYNSERSYQYGVWDSDRNYYQTAYQNAYNRDYGAHTDEQNRLYQEDRDRIADEQWEKSYNLQAAAASGKEVEGLNKEELDVVLDLYEEKNWEALDRYIGSLALSDATRQALWDSWLPADYGKTPPKLVWNPGNSPWISNSIN